jgi:hypothetical protein
MLSRLPRLNDRLVAVNIVIDTAFHKPFNSSQLLLNIVRKRLLEACGVFFPSPEQLIDLEIDTRR